MDTATGITRDVKASTDMDSAVDALDAVTTEGGQHELDPKQTLHRPADHGVSHSWLSRWIPTSTLESFANNWHLGNYVIDRKTGEKTWESMSIYVRLGMHLLYYGTRQEQLLEQKRTQDVLKQQSIKMGKQYDAPESVAHIQPFIDSFQLQASMQDMVEADPKKYKTFNEFFARAIKESARPIDEPQNEMVASSPADCRLTAFNTIDLATKYWVKGSGFTVERLLNNKDIAQQFDGGAIVIARLAPQDYHRWHAPVSGTVEQVYDIPGAYFTVNPQAINEPGVVDVFCENKRSVMMVKRAGTGASVAIIAVGAMLVGSIEYVDGVEKPGSEIRRGQCLGKFLYGGSTVIVLFPKGELKVDEDIAKNSSEQKCETLVKVGWRVGVKA